MNLVKETISFERGIDPKIMLGIGDYHIIEKCIKSIYKEDYKNLYIISLPGNVPMGGNIIYIHIKEENGKNKFIIQFYSNLFKNPITKKTISKEKYAKQLIFNAGISDYLTDCIYCNIDHKEKEELYQYICFIKPEYVRFFEKIRGLYEHNKYAYLKESLSFQRGIDPKAALGIGNDFHTLSRGAIFEPKILGIAVTQNRSGQFTNWLNGWKLYPGSYLLVVDVSNYSTDGKYKKIKFIRAYGEYTLSSNNHTTKSAWESVKEWKDVLLSNGDFRPFSRNNMIVSKKMFDNRFEIIERGI